MVDNNNSHDNQEDEVMIPFLSIAWFYEVFFKPDFVQKIFQLILPPGFSPNDKTAATIKIVDTFQDQIKKDGSDGRIKMFGNIPFATPWWSWLFR